MKRPEKSCDVIADIFAGRVAVDPVKSAEPPSSSGTTSAMASSVLSDAVRLAIASFACATTFLCL